MKKLTKEIVNFRLMDRGVVLVGDYTANKVKTEFKCGLGHHWQATPDSVMSGSGCPHCSDTHLSKEIINERLLDRGITLISDYTGALAKGTFMCHDGHHWQSTTNHVIRGSGCPHCSGKAQLSKDIVNQRIKDRELTMIGDYLGILSKTEFKCRHEHYWSATPGNIMTGSGCPTCNGKGGYNPNKPGVFYIIDFGHFIKYGITNDEKRRFNEHKRNGKFTTTFNVLFENGSDAQNLERRVKQEFGGGFATKDKLPNGYTETLCPTKLPLLMREVDSFLLLAKTTTSASS